MKSEACVNESALGPGASGLRRILTRPLSPGSSKNSTRNVLPASRHDQVT